MRRFTDEEKQTIKHLYYDLEYSMDMVAKELKTDLHTVWIWVHKFGVTRTCSQAQYIAVKYGRKKNPLREESRNWRGGRCKTQYGYFEILVPVDDPFYIMAKKKYKHLHGGYILEHRLVMAKYLNRPLTVNEIVHHLNGIRSDNRIENLALVSQTNHHRNTLMKLLQKRIQNLENKLSQQRLTIFYA